MLLQVELPAVHVYLCDMGLAQVRSGSSVFVQGNGSRDCHVHSARVIYGTFGPPTDVWAFGLVWIELFSGQYSWGNVINMMQMCRILQEKRMPLGLAKLDDCLKSLPEACLAHCPSARPSMSRVIQMFEQAQSDMGM